MRGESKTRFWNAVLSRVLGQRGDLPSLARAPAAATGPSGRLLDKDLSANRQCVTRKGLNYSRERWSRGKLRWRPVSILTCNSFVWVWC